MHGFADRSASRKFLAFLTVGVLFGCSSSCMGEPRADGSGASAATGSDDEDPANATIVDVVDGDTVRAEFGGGVVTVRLIGVDAPEVSGPYTTVECFGARSSAFTSEALDGRRVRLELDIEERDRFGRTLAYVWVGGVLFNERLVEEGFATVATFPPNVAYLARFLSAQDDAREHDRGLWRACG